ncbi:MAG: M48 family metallopeptidase [Bacteroidales bacterium]|nr:M48 family metallopeptidase [Bacteroidales bacterium]
MVEKIYHDPEIGEVRLRKSSRSRRVSIRVHPVRGIVVTVPYLTSYDTGMKFFLAKREWVKAAVARQNEVQKNVMALTPGQVEELRAKARAWLPGRLAALAATYGFAYKSLAIKNNKSNWGSCSTRGNINLNLRLAAVPEPLRDYVLLHELSHLRHHDHGPGFHALLENLCRDRMSVARYEDERDDKLRADILVFAARSRAVFPVSHLLEKAIRTYRLV